MNREELLKVAKPILFNTEMVQAILDSRKTVTRRTIKPKYSDSIFEMYKGILCETEPETPPIDLGNGNKSFKVRRFVECKQPYKVGDILYVRETWTKIEDFVNYADVEIEKDLKYLFKCDDSGKEHVFIDVGVKRWHPSIHMPKEAARIFLKVTDIRVERVQDMYVDDAINEGAWGNGIPTLPFSLLYKDHPTASCNAVASFAHIWDSTIKKQDIDKYGWDANPWVWAINFERVEVKNNE